MVMMQTFDEMMEELQKSKPSTWTIMKKENVKWDADEKWWNYRTLNDDESMGRPFRIWQPHSSFVPRSRSPEVKTVLGDISIDNIPGYRRRIPKAWVTAKEYRKSEGPFTNDRRKAVIVNGRPLRATTSTIASAKDKRRMAQEMKADADEIGYQAEHDHSGMSRGEYRQQEDLAETNSALREEEYNRKLAMVENQVMDIIKRYVRAQENWNAQSRYINNWNKEHPDYVDEHGKPLVTRPNVYLPDLTGIYQDDEGNYRAGGASELYKAIYDKVYRRVFGIPPKEETYTTVPRDAVDDWVSATRREYDIAHRVAEDKRKFYKENERKAQQWAQDEAEEDFLGRAGDYELAYNAFMNPMGVLEGQSRNPMGLVSNYTDLISRLRAQLDSQYSRMKTKLEANGVPEEEHYDYVLDSLLDANPAFEHSWNRAVELMQSLANHGIHVDEMGDIPEDVLGHIKRIQSRHDKQQFYMHGKEEVQKMIAEMRDGTRTSLPPSFSHWPEEFQEQARAALKTGKYANDKARSEARLHDRIQEMNRYSGYLPSWSKIEPLFHDPRFPEYIKYLALFDVHARGLYDYLSATGRNDDAILVKNLLETESANEAAGLVQRLQERAKELQASAKDDATAELVGRYLGVAKLAVDNMKHQQIQFSDNPSGISGSLKTLIPALNEEHALIGGGTVKFKDRVQEYLDYLNKREERTKDSYYTNEDGRKVYYDGLPINVTEDMKDALSVASGRAEVGSVDPYVVVPEIGRNKTRPDRFRKLIEEFAGISWADRVRLMNRIQGTITENPIDSAGKAKAEFYKDFLTMLQENDAIDDEGNIVLSGDFLDKARGAVQWKYSEHTDEVGDLEKLGLIPKHIKNGGVKYNDSIVDDAMSSVKGKGPSAEQARAMMGGDNPTFTSDMVPQYTGVIDENGRVATDAATGGYTNAEASLNTFLSRYHETQDPAEKQRMEAMAIIMLADPDFANRVGKQSVDKQGQRNYVADRPTIRSLEEFRDPEVFKQVKQYGEEVRENPVNTVDPVKEAYLNHQRELEVNESKAAMSRTASRREREIQEELSEQIDAKAEEFNNKPQGDEEQNIPNEIAEQRKDTEQTPRNNKKPRLHTRGMIRIKPPKQVDSAIAENVRPREVKQEEVEQEVNDVTKTPEQTETPEQIGKSAESAGQQMPMMSLRDMMISIQKTDGKAGHPYGKPLDGSVFAYGASHASIGEGKDPVMPKELPDPKGEAEGASSRKLDLGPSQ